MINSGEIQFNKFSLPAGYAPRPWHTDMHNTISEVLCYSEILFLSKPERIIINFDNGSFHTLLPYLLEEDRNELPYAKWSQRAQVQDLVVRTKLLIRAFYFFS